MKNLELLLCAFLLWTGCQKSKTTADTPTGGTTYIAADATLQPVIASEINAFERIYTNAKVHCQFGSEAEIFQALLRDSVRAVVAARDLTEAEKMHFEQKEIVPRYVPIGADAIVLLVNRNNPDSLLKFEELQVLFKGVITRWKDLNEQNSDGDVAIVFDQEGSSTVTSTMRLLGINQLPANAYALRTNKEVVDYVAKNQHALGVVGMSWISDLTDSERAQFNDKISIVYLRPANFQGDRYFKPDQINISEGNYPLYRRLQIINCEGKSGLVTGFATYVASPKGQLILLKAGILSATLPERVVHSPNE
ncbi:MAG: PstS family phosphate ABC transporter substrate-binding protein [Saprospiraceae bacterium]